MFTCQVCDKAYASQNSLKRHLNNHSLQQNGYRCPLCDLTFSRRDLMLRHQTIHGSAPRAVRRRCHTACKQCRLSHEKCNGEDPCAVCRARNQPCTYRPRTGRVSQPGSNITNAATDSTAPSADGNGRTPDKTQHTQDDVSEEAPSGGAAWQSSVTTDTPAFDPMDMELAPFVQDAHEESRGGTASGTKPRGDMMVDMESDMMPDYLDHALPDLWGIALDGSTVAPDNPPFPNAIPDNGMTESALWPGAESMPFELTGSDFFPFSFDVFEAGDDAFSLGRLALPTEEGSASRKTQQPSAPRPMEMQHQPLTPSSTSTGTEDVDPATRVEADVDDRRCWRETCHRQKALVGELVDYAMAATGTPPAERRRHWISVSSEVCTTFDLSPPGRAQNCILVEMAHLYKQNILPLWPMICEDGLEDPTSMHPVLFLVAVSIGAMYLDEKASVFGTLMHERLQTCLMTSFCEEEVSGADTIWLAQARNTIQVVALYFARGQELNYAQRLGALLIAQSRRMKLFSRPREEEFCPGQTAAEQVAAWVTAETRRRVAFGIFRADVFLSLLLNCLPSISADELEISLPYPDSLWLSIGKLAPEHLLAALEYERKQRDETLFCDLIRILLDRDEALLDMETRHYELVLFGLQKQVWTFSHDPDIFQRLIGQPWQDGGCPESLDIEISRVFNSTSLHARDQLQGNNHRHMKDLINDRTRLSMALEKWSKSFNASRSRPGHTSDRGSTLSSLLLFHIYHLQLNACLPALHDVAERLCSDKMVDYTRLQTAIHWAHDSQARQAAHHASKIWSLLDNEARMNPAKKARYTMLSFLGLYHASVVLWTCCGARRTMEQPCRAKDPDGGAAGDSHNTRSSEILRDIASLYQRLKCMNWDVYADSVRRLSFRQFPRG